MMFCPNCGKDCGDANFCSVCGKNLVQGNDALSFDEKKRALDASGQLYCPWCLSTKVIPYHDGRIQNEHLLYRTGFGRLAGSIVDDILKRRRRLYGEQVVCLQCDKRWHPKMEALYERHVAILSPLWKGGDGMRYWLTPGYYIQIDDSGLTIGRGPKGETFIEYYEIADVDFCEDATWLYGRLTVHDKRHRKKTFLKP